MAYHLWSPTYRKGNEIEDPLYEVDVDVDKGKPADRPQREARQRAQLRRETFAKIRKYQDEHPGSFDNPCDESALRWPHPEFKWPFSTHKDLHKAVINGILAGEECRSTRKLLSWISSTGSTFLFGPYVVSVMNCSARHTFANPRGTFRARARATTLQMTRMRIIIAVFPTKSKPRNHAWNRE